jgi:hypothetical protein
MEDDILPLFRKLEALAREGAVVVLKMDGERLHNLFTVLISRGQDEAFRKDGADVRALLTEALTWADEPRP